MGRAKDTGRTLHRSDSPGNRSAGRPTDGPTRVAHRVALRQRRPGSIWEWLAQVAIAPGAHLGAGAVDIIQTNPSAILVLEKGLSTHGGVFAAGTVVLAGPIQADPVLSRPWIDGAQWRCHPAISLR